MAARVSMMKTGIMDDSTVEPSGYRPIGYVAAALVTATFAYGVRWLQCEDAPPSTAPARAPGAGPTDDGAGEERPAGRPRLDPYLVENRAPDAITDDGTCACGPDHVEGSLIMLNENGGWTWFTDERAIVDDVGQKLVVSSVGNYLGHGEALREANVDVTTLDLATGRRTRARLARFPPQGRGDDVHVAALWQRPDGRYLAMRTGHLWRGDEASESFYRLTTNPHDGSSWGPEGIFSWPANDTTEPLYDDVTYSNLLYLAREGRLYNIARAADRMPNIMISDDEGASWRYGGKLTRTGPEGQHAQYSNGYFLFSSNGVDRFDFIATEHHPRDYDTSIYHGYVSGGRSYDASGRLLDADVFDEVAPEPADFTPVWTAAAPTPAPTKSSFHHGWPVDLERSADGSLHALFTARQGTCIADRLFGDCDHRLFYGRFDGTQWRTTEIARMGGPLFRSEQDYTGLGAIHPNDPSTIYVSTPIDPRDGTPTRRYELYRGVTRDGGTRWTWTPITWNSTMDNLRPLVPSWDADHTAVLWLRGSYLSLRRYDLTVVGLVDRSRDEATSRITYVDADERNTTRADGTPLTVTRGAARGEADELWHVRQDFGNASTLFTSNELGYEDAPPLRTTLTGLSPGTYDLFAFYWVNPDEDWRVRAGMSAAETLVFRQEGSQLSVSGHFEDGREVATIGDTVRMYRAYVGRATVEAGGAIAVFVDDAGGGPNERTWYDGLGYARVTPAGERDAEEPEGPRQPDKGQVKGARARSARSRP